VIKQLQAFLSTLLDSLRDLAPIILVVALAFAFALGFGTTVAEPALIAVAEEASKAAANGGVIPNVEAEREQYALGLRITVALSVGFAIVIGVLRILRGWPIQWVIVAGYMGVVVMTQFAPREIVGIAYDSGGVTTSTITVPLVTALGVGLASSIKGRNPMTDGFGLIAFASLTPMIFAPANPAAAPGPDRLRLCPSRTRAVPGRPGESTLSAWQGDGCPAHRSRVHHRWRR
jgi:hypothetical protein